MVPIRDDRSFRTPALYIDFVIYWEGEVAVLNGQSLGAPARVIGRVRLRSGACILTWSVGLVLHLDTTTA